MLVSNVGLTFMYFCFTEKLWQLEMCLTIWIISQTVPALFMMMYYPRRIAKILSKPRWFGTDKTTSGNMKWAASTNADILFNKSSSNPCPVKHSSAYRGRVKHIYISNLDQQWLTKCLVACSAPSHFLNQRLIVVNWAICNEYRGNLNQIHTRKLIW